MLEKLLDGSFMPHGHCLLWRTDLLFLHLSGDILTVIAYFLIPVALVYVVKKRDDLKFDSIFMLFAGFIFFCGLTHLFGVINIWHGYYYFHGIIKLATGVVSITTAIVLWKLMPGILAIPSNKDLEERNTELVFIQEQLEQSNRTLEERVKERTRELAELARTDSLTGVNNHGEILQQIKMEMERSERFDHPPAILMLDIDHFKQVNDKYGHLAGDRILLDVANKLRESCRQIDRLGRYGGEEFIVLCPETGLDAARDIAERIRLAVASLSYDDLPQVTCSIGVTTMKSGQTAEELINAADAAMYEAKHAGRNRVVTSPSS